MQFEFAKDRTHQIVSREVTPRTQAAGQGKQRVEPTFPLRAQGAAQRFELAFELPGSADEGRWAGERQHAST